MTNFLSSIQARASDETVYTESKDCPLVQSRKRANYLYNWSNIIVFLLLASAWLPHPAMSRREALVGNPPSSAAPEVPGNSTEASGPGPHETKDEMFSKVKDKFMNELHKIPRK